MSNDSGKTNKKRRIGDKTSNELRTKRNKARRIAKDERRQARDADKRGHRAKLRAKGNLRRWQAKYVDRLKAAESIKDSGVRDAATQQLYFVNSRLIEFAA